MNEANDQLSAGEVGERIRIARENAGKTQAVAAQAIGVARTTLVAMEKGVRRAKIGELQKLARFLDTSTNALLRKEAVHVELTPKFRRLTENEGEPVAAAADLMAQLVRAEVELEALLGVEHVRNLPPERRILAGGVRQQAEQHALELRHWLGLGLAPIADIVTLLELQMGVRVYARSLVARISGLFAYDEKVGACILLNANHPIDRRTQTAAHELGHLVATRGDAEVYEIDELESSREEKYANTFARSFLTPAQAVRQKFAEVTAGATSLTRRHVIVLAHYFHVSREALVRRLEELQLTKKGTWDWFVQNGNITDEQAQQVLGDVSRNDYLKDDAGRSVSLRTGLMAYEAAKRGLLSEGQIAKLLRLDRVQVRDLLSDVDAEESGANAATSILR
ncbi:XRE family transcriptional regulator [Mesorhizobium sp.]|uniref:XRE family transcriptional regulator n=1 Tax=Mesorhizobium sp. TaxID=1871066 RepID=UPI000FE89A47|nr:XRE family transcriptional regulator [Mesorhizobium sp.]RWB28022.1 MAG: ImmA/IrrE family metallo-endopeptidase [Mesorhizobium sp.]RWE67269.1 MAG: ImmA/IrrE family metallo-endopeptidase [Mesorhizobium sp.]RWI14462.1 MAG: ImmA/IrrE family metallo-endopeptidase [Mesorhizobium sp.]RWK32890.1 MAG: ImmA/IrrE family metallo-endopeptidase [Mesorhizobium sp.]RWK90117.1 MAG: ImmA/IrrE family metallo-endopeptidase [Mesorhizobium sp.]